MLLVDSVASLEKWSRIVGLKAVTGAESCYGHLGEDAADDDYAYPCALIIESFGQTGGILINEKRRHDGASADTLMLFAGLSDFRFSGKVFPGDVMEHRVTLERDAADFAILSGQVFVGGREVARAESAIVAYRHSSALTMAATPD